MHDKDNIIYGIYLLLLLAFVASSFLLSRRRHLNQSLQQIAIWCIILFALIAIYGLKDTIIEQLFPSHPAIHKDGSYVFQRHNDGQFYATLTINNTPIRFIIDTGASGIVLTKYDANLVGFNEKDLIFSHNAQTANGLVKLAPIHLETIQIGHTIHRHVYASVNGGELHNSLLGMDYINRFSEFKIIKNHLYLIP